ncbi:hypothetical protein Metbo_1112 [Methanobacterium lacus]|uniref:Uncharacterized protein n=1 Tax=Methanobacterium lacus (strain AL-21) TaxID=877455 RepID=F0T5W4_METLA|nr:HEPN domain-containing protein [Methanobacterium lacus]ADZ09357.1 hypothetical protein Metbo_1112 [Methanobacterium lacus]
MEKFEERGVFWVPEKNVKLSGVLRFDPQEKIELEIFGSKGETNYPLFSGKIHHEIMLGVISGRNVTLYHCHQIKGQIKDNEFMTLIFDINTIFLGYHFKNKKDICFNSLDIEYSYLEDWVDRTGFNVYPILNSKRYIEEYTTTYKYPQNVHAKLDNFQIQIRFRFQPLQYKYKIDLKQDTYLEIIPNEVIHFKEYKQKILDNIQNFLTLGISEPLFPINITGKIKKNNVKNDDKYPNYTNIEIFYRTITAHFPKKQMNTWDMFFSLEDINFNECLNNWFRKYENLKPVIQLYFGILNNPSHLENNFINLAQAIESYHRRTFQGKYMPTKEYKKLSKILKEKIPEKIAKDHKNSLKSKIDFGNEFSLQTRLYEIFEKYEDVLKININNQDEFIKDVKNTRNFLTHYNKNLEIKAKTKNEDLFDLIQKLKFMLEVCFLFELGINSTKIMKLVSQDKRYQTKYQFYD